MKVRTPGVASPPRFPGVSDEADREFYPVAGSTSCRRTRAVPDLEAAAPRLIADRECHRPWTSANLQAGASTMVAVAIARQTPARIPPTCRHPLDCKEVQRSAAVFAQNLDRKS